CRASSGRASRLRFVWAFVVGGLVVSLIVLLSIRQGEWNVPENFSPHAGQTRVLSETPASPRGSGRGSGSTMMGDQYNAPRGPRRKNLRTGAVLEFFDTP